MSDFEVYKRYQIALENEDNHDMLVKWAHDNTGKFYDVIEKEWEKEHKLREQIWDINIELVNRSLGCGRMEGTTTALKQTLSQLESIKRLKYGFRNK